MAITINGSGTITGISAGGLPDGCVDADTLGTDSVTAAKLKSDAITYGDLPSGTVLQVVTRTSDTSIINNSTSYADTGLSTTITPKVGTSILLCRVSHCVYGNDSSGSCILYTKISDGVDEDIWSFYDNGTSNNYALNSSVEEIVFSVNSRSSITITVSSAQNPAYNNQWHNSGTAVLTITEIAG